MSQYNRLRLAENLHAEVTDQSVYLAHEDSQWATALDHDQFEELTEFYEDVREDVQPTNRMRVTVYDEDNYPIRTEETQQEEVAYIVAKYDRQFPDDHRFEVESL